MSNFEKFNRPTFREVRVAVLSPSTLRQLATGVRYKAASAASTVNWRTDLEDVVGVLVLRGG